MALPLCTHTACISANLLAGEAECYAASNATRVMLVEIILYKQQHGISNCGQQKLQSAEAAVSRSCSQIRFMLSSVTVDSLKGLTGWTQCPVHLC